jgi:uncharacterized hydantoinase/oxoprolinase family protein
MIVECNGIQEFCQELAREAQAGCVREAVRVRIDRHPQQDEEITFTVGIWATALVQRPVGFYILEAGIVCREVDDYSSNPPDGSGTAEAEAMKQQIAKVCDEQSLPLAGGKWE